jgi:acyl transferase domain-containing protein
VALESAGHDPDAEDRRYGLFAGVGMNRYLLNNLLQHPDLIAAADPYGLMLGNEKDFAPTRTSYKLNLKGPSISVQTACSTSLVAVHLACRSLLAGECDTALAGGCSVTLPQDRGYLHQQGMILSPDGHCRAFDSRAQGTVCGNGVGVVVLKRLADALADGDTVHAVIRGSAINNDGSAKAGYTAPSIAGQADVIKAALAAANIAADTIGYVEAHGTATPLGDPIEIAALTKTFRVATPRSGFCAIGSVKTNVGHLDSAAGVTGLLKAVLAVEHGVVPPSLHFHEPNPALDLAQSPFFVPVALRSWPLEEGPRRAGVSSFGIGGTNAHVILEQAPPRLPGGPARPWQLLVLSAREPAALQDATIQLAARLRQSDRPDLADAAFTLALGRRGFAHRRVLVCRSGSEAADILDGKTVGKPQLPRPQTAVAPAATPSVAFMFSGQGSQHVGMAAELYRTEASFRAEVDHCAEVLRPLLGYDIVDVFKPAVDASGTAGDALRRTALAQPALFVAEYALARLWMAWGVRPAALIGHSLGEYVAACLAGVWTLEDALALIAFRAGLMERQPVGSMLAVSLPEAALRDWLRPGLSLAAINGPGQCVVAGPHEAITALASDLAERAIACRALQTSHAFHSALMEPAMEPLAAFLGALPCQPPKIPLVSNLTGTWLEPWQAVDPRYWARHLRETVRFADGLETLLQEPGRCLIEVGPGNVLATAAGRHPQRAAGQLVLTSLPHPQQPVSDVAHLLQTAGQLWLVGVSIDWHAFYTGQRRRRVSLPTYPFQRRRYWIDPPAAGISGSATPQRNRDMRDWFYVPSWQRTPPCATAAELGTQWLLFMDEGPIAAALADQLDRQGAGVTKVHAGGGFTGRGDGHFVIEPGSQDDHRQLIEILLRSERLPDVIVYLWTLGQSGAARERCFHGLVALARALGEREPAQRCHIAVVSTGLHEVTGGETTDPAKSLLLGPVTVIPQEYQHLSATSIDLDDTAADIDGQIARLIADAAVCRGDSPIAYRGGHRWAQVFLPLPLSVEPPPLKPQGVYVIIGGTGGIGLKLAEWLIRRSPAGVRLALISRSAEASGVDPPIERLGLLGADVLTVTADVADRAQMRAAIDRIEARFGSPDGVIHAAGIAGGGTMRTMTQERAEQAFRAKVDGCLVLASVLADTPLDFFVLCSSLTAITGGLGQVAYTAANAFEDAFAQAEAARGVWRRVVAIDWDRWQGVGMAAAWEARHNDLLGAAAGEGMAQEAGAEAFGHILAAASVPRIVVSTRDLPPLVRQSRGWQLGQIGLQLEQAASRPTLHPRPVLATDYIAPDGDVEIEIAAIWREEIGIDQVGAADDFFALGGDSLIAIKLIARLRQALQVPLDVGTLYSAPTISALAEHVAAVRWAAQAPALESKEDSEEGVL